MYGFACAAGYSELAVLFVYEKLEFQISGKAKRLATFALNLLGWSASMKYSISMGNVCIFNVDKVSFVDTNI